MPGFRVAGENEPGKAALVYLNQRRSFFSALVFGFVRAILALMSIVIRRALDHAEGKHANDTAD
jgi:hypothetical protein